MYVCVCVTQDLTIRRLEEKIRGLEAALEEKSLEVEEVCVCVCVCVYVCVSARATGYK